MVTLERAKHNMRIDYDDDDALICSFIAVAEHIVSDILRYEVPDDDVLTDQAMLIAVAYLYENREKPNIKQLKMTIRDILVDLRGCGF